MKKFPFVKQHDSMQCGAACLTMICRYYGNNLSLDKLDKMCDTTHEGISLFTIDKVAKQIGFETICGKIKNSRLSDIQLPCILHWNDNHFVILYKIKNKNYYIADPYKGLLKYNTQEFNYHWLKGENEDGIIMLLKPSKYVKTKKSKSENCNKFNVLNFFYNT